MVLLSDDVDAAAAGPPPESATTTTAVEAVTTDNSAMEMTPAREVVRFMSGSCLSMCCRSDVAAAPPVSSTRFIATLVADCADRLAA